MLTLAPLAFTASVARMTSGNWVPATKRPENLRPTGEVSAKWRSDWFSERPIKKDLSMWAPARG